MTSEYPKTNSLYSMQHYPLQLKLKILSPTKVSL